MNQHLTIRDLAINMIGKTIEVTIPAEDGTPLTLRGTLQYFEFDTETTSTVGGHHLNTTPTQVDVTIAGIRLTLTTTTKLSIIQEPTP